MTKSARIHIPIEKYRADAAQPDWELPMWGHPLSQGVMPLFISIGGRLLPIGTAFTIGKGVSFLVSAMHNILEAFKHEQRLGYLAGCKNLRQAVELKEVGFYVLHQRWKEEAEINIELTLLPLETIDGAPPTDVALGFPLFKEGLPTISLPLSFDLPLRGERMWSIGYTDFSPKEIDLESVMTGTFDWRIDYRHRFVVVEGHVDRIFIQRFTSTFVGGPCFTFNAEIFHGQSGGPIINEDGLVCGVNSAGATMFFNGPTSIASLLYPVLMTNLRSGVQRGPIRLNFEQPLLLWIAHGTVTTDGSEVNVGIHSEGDSYFLSPQAPIDIQDFVHDDFSGFQNGRRAMYESREHFRFRYTDSSKKT